MIAEITEERDTLDGHLAHATGLAEARLDIVCRLERELAEAKKDKARLDWLSKRTSKKRESVVIESEFYGKTLREAIDAAMEDPNQ